MQVDEYIYLILQYRTFIQLCLLNFFIQPDNNENKHKHETNRIKYQASLRIAKKIIFKNKVNLYKT